MATLQELRETLEHYLRSLTTESQRKDLVSVLKGKGTGLGVLPPHILNAAIELRTRNSGLANQIVGSIKISLSPAFTKHARDYATNPYDLCHLLSLLWIRAHILQPTSAVTTQTRSQKPEFFAATTAYFMPLISSPLNDAERQKMIDALFERLITNGFIEPGDWAQKFIQLTCENFIGTQVAAIYTIPLAHFALMIHQIVSNMFTIGMNRIAVYIASQVLQHGMAMVISIKEFYVTVRFYNPNALQGDAKVHFHSADAKEIYFPKIDALMNFSESYYAENTDFTLICLNISHTGIHQFIPNFYCHSGLESECLITLAQEGDHGSYLNAIRMLVHIHGINLNATGGQGATALIMASQVGHSNVVRILVDRPFIDLDVQASNRATALIVAVLEGHANVVEVLISKLDTDINITIDGWSALSFAIDDNKSDIVMLLLRRQDLIITDYDRARAQDKGIPLLPCI